MAGTILREAHFPGRAPIEAYGNGGFRFADMSHRGSLLCLPSGMHAWDVVDPSGIARESLEPVFAERESIGLLLLGTGRDVVFIPEALRWHFREAGIGLDVMPTNAATRTWNILLGENRRVAAALIAVP